MPQFDTHTVNLHCPAFPVEKRAQYPRVSEDFNLFFPDRQMRDDWLKALIKELARKVMWTRPSTRASTNDILSGNDIYGKASLVAPAVEC